MKNRQLTTISFFTGVGGFDFGATLAGFTSLFRSDWWDVPGKVFELNRDNDGKKGIPEYLRSEGVFLAGPDKGDITKLDFNKVREAIYGGTGRQIKKGEVDVVIGGPPCQGISLANPDRSPDDEKNKLIFEYLRMIMEIEPKVALMEQVPSILGDKMLPLMNRLVRALEEMRTKYHYRFDILDAKNYGSKQSRKRLIIMFVRKDLNVVPSFPNGAKPDLDKVSVNKLLPHVIHTSSGQFTNRIKSAKNNIMGTITASGCEWVYGVDGKARRMTIPEKLVLTDLVGLNLETISTTDCNRLLGNMVQVHFSKSLFLHIKREILQAA